VSRLLSTKEAAEYLHADPSTVRRLYYAGSLPAVNCFKHLRFDLADLDKFIAANKDGGGR